MNKRIALITFCSYDAINSPMINSAEYLASQGYTVDVFARSPFKFDVPVFQNKAIRYRITQMPRRRIINRFGLLFLLLDAWREMRRHRYDMVIGFDPQAFQNARLLGWRFRIPAVHHSLEFHPYDTFKQRIRRALEAFFLRRADWMITQDAMRADWLSRKLRFPREKISTVYNAAFGEYLPRKSSYFRDRFNIPAEKKVVLAVGSLIKVHMIHEVAESVARWPQEFVLVIHGWFMDPEYEKQIRTLAGQNPGRILISTDFLPIERKYEAFQSADIGLVPFTPDIENNLLVGAAAGKLFEFARCGVPVVTNDLPGMRELIGGRCGEVCGLWLENIEQALSRISSGYAHYTAACRDFYAEYGFAGSYKKFLDIFR